MKMTDFIAKYLNGDATPAYVGMMRLTANPDLILALRNEVRNNPALLNNMSSIGANALFGYGKHADAVRHIAVLKGVDTDPNFDLRGYTVYTQVELGGPWKVEYIPIADYDKTTPGVFDTTADDGVLEVIRDATARTYGRYRMAVQLGNHSPESGTKYGKQIETAGGEIPPGAELVEDTLTAEKTAEDTGIDLNEIRATVTTQDYDAMFPHPNIKHRIVLNAARPIYGDQTAVGDFLFGKHYAEIDPNSRQFAAQLKAAVDQGAGIVIFASDALIDRMAYMLMPDAYRKKYDSANPNVQRNALKMARDKLHGMAYGKLNALLDDAILHELETPTELYNADPAVVAEVQAEAAEPEMVKNIYGTMVPRAVWGATPFGLNEAELAILMATRKLKAFARKDNLRLIGMSEAMFNDMRDKMNAAGVFLKRSALTPLGQEAVDVFQRQHGGSRDLYDLGWDFSKINQSTPATTTTINTIPTERPPVIVPPSVAELAAEIPVGKTLQDISIAQRTVKQTYELIAQSDYRLNDLAGYTREEFQKENVPALLTNSAAVLVALSKNPNLTDPLISSLNMRLASIDHLLTRWKAANVK